MNNKVKILLEGYAKVYDDYEDVSSSVVLIENEKHKIIVAQVLIEKIC